jgi:hypothetical protein
MFKYIAVILLGLMIAGCQPQQQVITRTQIQVIVPPAELFTCHRLLVSQLPNTETLTVNQVARIMRKLIKDNAECANNMDAIKAYLQKAKIELEAPSNRPQR